MKTTIISMSTWPSVQWTTKTEHVNPPLNIQWSAYTKKKKKIEKLILSKLKNNTYNYCTSLKYVHYGIYDISQDWIIAYSSIHPYHFVFHNEQTNPKQQNWVTYGDDYPHKKHFIIKYIDILFSFPPSICSTWF